MAGAQLANWLHNCLSVNRGVEVKELTNAVILCTDTDNEIRFLRGHRCEPWSPILGIPNINPAAQIEPFNPASLPRWNQRLCLQLIFLAKSRSRRQKPSHGQVDPYYMA